MILFADVFIGQVEIRLFCDLHTGMSENFAEGKDIHAIHQASLGEIISQAVRTVFLVQSDPIDVPLEVGFKVVDIDVTAVFLDREEVLAFHISVLKLKPTPQCDLRFRREIHCSVFASLGFLCSEVDAFSGKFHICDQECRTLAQTHTAVQHEQNHNIISVFGEVGLVKLTEQLSQIFVGKEYLRLSIVLQLANLSHGILLDHIVPFEPIEKHTQIADVIVDGGNTNRFSEVSASLRVVLIFREIVDIEGVFSSLLEVGDVSADQVFSHLVYAINFMFVATPSLK